MQVDVTMPCFEREREKECAKREREKRGDIKRNVQKERERNEATLTGMLTNEQ